jgi:arginine decarboxylase
MTNSTYDGLCYNADNIKATSRQQRGGASSDEAYAHANFIEFYDGYHAISQHIQRVRRSRLICEPSSRTTLLAALSQASMIHVQHAENKGWICCVSTMRS